MRGISLGKLHERRQSCEAAGTDPIEQTSLCLGRGNSDKNVGFDYRQVCATRGDAIRRRRLATSYNVVRLQRTRRQTCRYGLMSAIMRVCAASTDFTTSPRLPGPLRRTSTSTPACSACGSSSAASIRTIPGPITCSTPTRRAVPDPISRSFRGRTWRRRGRGMASRWKSDSRCRTESLALLGRSAAALRHRDRTARNAIRQTRPGAHRSRTA